ncbi:MAG: hypothetical protein RLZZ511_4390, partial [Cyanobacteriota bacterium]
MSAILRHALPEDLPRIVEIYNAAIPGRLATADTEVITVESRQAWFAAHNSDRRPLWVLEQKGAIVAWLGIQDFYGRPAYGATVELSLYVAPAAQHRGCGTQLMAHLMQAAPQLGITTLLGFVFGHNQPSLGLCAKARHGRVQGRARAGSAHAWPRTVPHQAAGGGSRKPARHE